MNWRDCFILCFLTGVNCIDCPQPYLPIDSENACIYMSSRAVALNEMEGYCASEANGGKPFNRRFSDEGISELGKNLKLSVESLFPPEVYVGITREKDGMNQPTKNWLFANNQGSVDEKLYELWTREPNMQDCGSVTYLENFKVNPFSCTDSAVFLCEKNEFPCEYSTLPFVEYHQKCLSIFPRKDNYMTAESICGQMGAHLFPYKSSNDSDSVGAAIYSSITFDGGIYAGLRKNEMGQWKYESGEEETKRWDPEDELHQDCGVYGFLKNLTIGMFTMNCDDKLRLLCEIKPEKL
ncbi:unnamed protein product [Larinioides sclopetarius]|uniref:C-type lectin domain-containing protein n=1 Tax=Larinioides sclopetarius TaxID=280406 RepID=A0AAV1ZMX2_9ARAC